MCLIKQSLFLPLQKICLLDLGMFKKSTTACYLSCQKNILIAYVKLSSSTASTNIILITKVQELIRFTNNDEWVRRASPHLRGFIPMYFCFKRYTFMKHESISPCFSPRLHVLSKMS